MKSLISILSILFIFIISACAGPRLHMTQQQEADMLYAKASQLQDEESFDEANTQFEEYAKKYPESKRADNAKLQIADTNFQQGKYDQAIAVYQEILTQYQESDASDHALLSIGDVYFININTMKLLKHITRYFRSIQDLEQILRSMPVIEYVQ